MYSIWDWSSESRWPWAQMKVKSGWVGSGNKLNIAPVGLGWVGLGWVGLARVGVQSNIN